MVFFAAGATDSTAKVALTNTNISIHTLIIIIPLIGFEIARSL
jgi:hypothetical protein